MLRVSRGVQNKIKYELTMLKQEKKSEAKGDACGGPQQINEEISLVGVVKVHPGSAIGTCCLGLEVAVPRSARKDQSR